MHDITCEVERPARSHEPVEAAAELLREINSGGIARGNVGCTVKNPASHAQVGYNVTVGGEVPLRWNAIHAHAIGGLRWYDPRKL